MAGDVNKSVEITLRANLKQFQTSLAQIPGMTKKEAGQMTRALAAEFRKSTKAAHKAAEESKKAARATAKEYKKTSEKVSDSFSKQAQAAKRSSDSMVTHFGRANTAMSQTRRQSRDFGAALGSLEDVVGAINPELATLTMEIGAAGQAARSLSRSLATGNVVLMSIVGVLLAAAAAYTLFTSKSANAKKEFQEFSNKAKDSSRNINQLANDIENLSQTLDKGLGDPNAARIDALHEESRLVRELAFIRGGYTKTEKELSEIHDNSRRQIRIIGNDSQKLRDLAEERRKKAVERLDLLDTEYRELFRIRNQLGLNTKERADATKQLHEITAEETKLQKIVSNHRSLISDINKEEKIRVERVKSTTKLEQEIAKEKEKQEKIEKARERAEKKRIEFMKLATLIDTEATQLQQESQDLAISILPKEEQIKQIAQQKRDALDGQLDSMRAQVDKLALQAKTQEETAFIANARLDIERSSEAVQKSKEAITAQEKKDLEELNKKTEDLLEKREKMFQISSLRVSLESAALSAFLDNVPASEQLEAQEIKLALSKQETIDKIREATEASLESAETQEERDMIEADRKRAMFAAESKYIMDLDTLREKAHQKSLSQTLEGTKVFLSGISSATTASLEMLEKSGSKNKKLITALFLANRAAAIGEIVMNTAKSITAAPAQFGPFAPIAIAGYVATAAAQTATVMSQQPPRFHMGGMVDKTPDERVVIVKQGEAILDRATVNALGDQGVSRLQNGQSMSPEVIVMNPYKHFDRFVRDRERSGLSSTRSARRGY